MIIDFTISPKLQDLFFIGKKQLTQNDFLHAHL